MGASCFPAGATSIWQETVHCTHKEVYQELDPQATTPETTRVQETHWKSYQIPLVKPQGPSIVSFPHSFISYHIISSTILIFTKVFEWYIYICECSFVGESMHDEGTVVFAYYKEGACDPTFLYFAHGLKEVKCWGHLL